MNQDEAFLLHSVATSVYTLVSVRYCFSARPLWHVPSSLLRADMYSGCTNSSCMPLLIAMKSVMLYRILKSDYITVITCVWSSSLSTQRSCCVSSSFWRSTWRVPVPAAGSHPQHVQACCPLWWTHCVLGQLQMCWWCRSASLMIVSLRATIIVSSW